MNSVAPQRAGRREWIGLAVLALPCILFAKDLTVLNLAVPSLSADLQPSSAPASGKSYSISEIHIFRVSNGKVVEHWRDADMLGMMQQLGVMPAPGKSGN